MPELLLHLKDEDLEQELSVSSSITRKKMLLSLEKSRASLMAKKVNQEDPEDGLDFWVSIIAFRVLLAFKNSTCTYIISFIDIFS